MVTTSHFQQMHLQVLFSVRLSESLKLLRLKSRDRQITLGAEELIFPRLHMCIKIHLAKIRFGENICYICAYISYLMFGNISISEY